MFDGLCFFQDPLGRVFDVLKTLANSFISQREDCVLGVIEDVLRLIFFFQRFGW